MRAAAVLLQLLKMASLLLLVCLLSSIGGMAVAYLVQRLIGTAQ